MTQHEGAGLVLERAPVQADHALEHRAGDRARAKREHAVGEIARGLRISLTGGHVVVREVAAVLPDNLDARVGAGDVLQVISDRRGVQAELQAKLRMPLEDARGDAVHPVHDDLGDEAAVHPLLGGLGETLEIQPVALRAGVLALVLLHHRVGRPVKRRLIRQVEMDAGVPAPGVPPDHANAQRMGDLHHLARIDRQKVVPDDDLVELQARHVLQVAAHVVDRVTPRPQAAVKNDRRAELIGGGQRVPGEDRAAIVGRA